MCLSAGNDKSSLETYSWPMSWKTENKRAPLLLPMESNCCQLPTITPGDVNAGIFANRMLSLISDFAFACISFYSLLSLFPVFEGCLPLGVSSSFLYPKPFAFFLKMLLTQSPIPSSPACQSLHVFWEIKIKQIQDVNKTYDPEKIFALDILQRI